MHFHVLIVHADIASLLINSRFNNSSWFLLCCPCNLYIPLAFCSWPHKLFPLTWMCFILLWQGGLSPIDLKVETYFHRAAPGGTGGVKTISNYAPVWTGPHNFNVIMCRCPIEFYFIFLNMSWSMFPWCTNDVCFSSLVENLITHYATNVGTQNSIDS